MSKKKIVKMETIKNRIFTIRGMQVMIDKECKEIYHIGASLKEAFDPDGQEPGRKQLLQSKEV